MSQQSAIRHKHPKNTDRRVKQSPQCGFHLTAMEARFWSKGKVTNQSGI